MAKDIVIDEAFIKRAKELVVSAESGKDEEVRWLAKGAESEELPNEGHVVVNVGTKKVGFVVNHLIGREEVVIKPLGSLLQGTDGLAGAAITGDGKIALILDVPALMTSCAC